MKIGPLDTADRVLLIAEIGNNHEGDFAVAERMIGEAAACGVDAVKFQTIDPAKLVRRDDADRRAQLGRFALSRDQFEHLKSRADGEGVMFLSTPFDVECLEWLAPLVPAIKISSSDNTFTPLLERAAATGKPLLISTGLATPATIDALLATLAAAWARTAVPAPGLALLHCVVSYPTPDAEAGLAAIPLLADYPGVTPGYSDHTLGIEAAVLAVAAGARVIEKHFTLDKSRTSFRDHALSADPADMRLLVERIRHASLLMGAPRFGDRECERGSSAAVRRSLAARTDLSAGHVLQPADLTWLRPGTGIAVGDEARVIGRTLKAAVAAGQLFAPEQFG
jgi:N,N'-diacetyllegionaminate synthase